MALEEGEPPVGCGSGDAAGSLALIEDAGYVGRAAMRIGRRHTPLGSAHQRLAFAKMRHERLSVEDWLWDSDVADAIGNRVGFLLLDGSIARVVPYEWLARSFKAFDPTQMAGRRGPGTGPLGIRAAELRSSLSLLGDNLSAGEVRAVMEQVDTNRDGVISFDEFAYGSSAESKVLLAAGVELAELREERGAVSARTLQRPESKRFH